MAPLSFTCSHLLAFGAICVCFTLYVSSLHTSMMCESDSEQNLRLPASLGEGVVAATALELPPNVTASSKTSNAIQSSTIIKTTQFWNNLSGCVEPIRVVISLQLKDKTAASEFQAAIKSMAMSASCPIQVFLIHESANATTIRSLVDQVLAPGIEFRYYSYDGNELRSRFAALGATTDHHSGIFGLAKYFLPQLLPDVHGSVLLVDIDMLFLADVCVLRHYLRDGQVFALPVFSETDWSNICSCIVVLHLDRARALDWENLPTKLNIRMPVRGDQQIFYGIRKHALARKLPWATKLPSDWDVEGCHKFQADKFVGVLHYNCQWSGKPKAETFNGRAFYFWHEYPLSNMRMLRQHWKDVQMCTTE
eukprot:TRINITY_DN21838_c0_g1_i1.p1 TRINITY_DN21838_c0_g1~~TRINITY_DN21838_c0_g1_i1.p1  ORF type:complete len:365 (+),score=26.84 TRINITY_DN21838_c0_g1_i1:64-1158(+)